MTARTNLVKSSLLALGLGATLSSPGAANAQTIVYAAGGSSALLGNIQKNPLGLGAIPTLITSFTGNLTSFSSVGTTAQGLLQGKATISGENTTDALVLYTSAQASSSTSATSTNIIILVRSDSGYGIRYVANKESITGWTFSQAYDFSTQAARANTNLDTAVENYLIANKNTATEAIDNGLSDVDGDTIATYAGFSGLNLAGLTGAQHDLLPVQTLVFLYNNKHGLGNVTRTQAKSLIGGLPGDPNGDPITWGEILGTSNTDPVHAYYRESTSGTRNTELLNVQRAGVIASTDAAPNSFASIIAENQYGAGLASFNSTPGTNYAVSGANDANGTGDMLNAVNNDTDAFGYAFVTGAPGSKANVEVASYDGVHPLDTTSFPIQSDGGQLLPASYSLQATTHYPPIIYGIYELWAYGNQYQVASNPQATAANQIVALLDNNLTAQEVHSLGFTRVSELKVTRVATQGVTIASDVVTDGQLITFDLSAALTPNSATPPVYGLPLVVGQSGVFGGSQNVLQSIIE